MKKSTKLIEIPVVQWESVRVTLRGLTPLIVKQFDEKAKQMMAAKQNGDPQQKREKKVPKEHFERARLRDAKGRDCIRALWIKCACIDAARFVEGVKMTELRGALFVEGDMLPLKYKKITMGCDPVRVGMTADLAYRPYYSDWSVEAVVRFRPNMLTAASVFNLLNNAGQSIGLCERRPGQNGDTYGMFEIEVPKRKRAA